jgi:hypothetical protein
MDIELYEERLDDIKHFEIVDYFSCGIYEPLNTFIKDCAFEYNRNGIGNTFLLLCNQEGNIDIVCYYTLRANSLCINHEYIPVIEISRFAVNKDYQRQGIGTSCILNVIVNKVLDVKKHIGVAGILVFADTQESLSFYKKIGFKDFSDIQDGKNKILVVDDGFNEDCHVLILGVDKNNINEIYEKSRT